MATRKLRARRKKPKGSNEQRKNVESQPVDDSMVFSPPCDVTKWEREVAAHYGNAAREMISTIKPCTSTRPPEDASECSSTIEGQHSAIMMSLYSNLPIYFPGNKQKTANGIEVRLLRLLPKFMGETLMCNMHCVALQEKPTFVALSYSWGDSSRTKHIVVRGHSVSVTANLYQALEQLRKQEDSVLVWADALCINQSNIRERNYQVTQMPRIYSAAHTVIAWLGASTPASNRALRLIKAPPRDLDLIDKPDVLGCLTDIFSRPYWKRVWIVQELAAAQRSKRACEVHCGTVSITLEQLGDFLRMFLRHFRIRKLETTMHPRVILTLSSQDSSRTFLKVLWESANLESTNECDRIYGMRGIIPKFYRDNIKVDYSERSTFEKLSVMVMTLIISKERNLDILCYFHALRGFTPSWLRDFRLRCSGISPEMYSADGGRRAAASIVNRILRVKGMCIGQVMTTNLCYLSDSNWYFFSNLSKFQDVASQTFTRLYGDHKSLWASNRFLEMVIGGRQHAINFSDKDLSRLRLIWDKIVSYEKSMGPRMCISPAEHASFCSIFGRLLRRSVVTTVEGNIGLAPSQTEEGDLICILYGCSLPVVLRKDGRYYRFVGPAYVDGAMNGEMVNNLDKADQFWIR